jgi:hypothetical protein
MGSIFDAATPTRDHPVVAALPDGLNTLHQWSRQEAFGRMKDAHNLAPEAHVARMMPQTGLRLTSAEIAAPIASTAVVVASGIDV